MQRQQIAYLLILALIILGGAAIAYARYNSRDHRHRRRDIRERDEYREFMDKRDDK